jgi:hypothetical protein
MHTHVLLGAYALECLSFKLLGAYALECYHSPVGGLCPGML